MFNNKNFKENDKVPLLSWAGSLTVLVLAVICGTAPCIRQTVCLPLIRPVTNTKFPESHAKRGGNSCDTTETEWKSVIAAVFMRWFQGVWTSLTRDDRVPLSLQSRGRRKRNKSKKRKEGRRRNSTRKPSSVHWRQKLLLWIMYKGC